MKDLPTDDKGWRDLLTPEQYQIMRQKGTEAPFTGRLLHNEATGQYTCAACGNPLFSSEHKFDSGSGWPSFYDVIDKGAVKLQEDNGHGMRRVEVTCASCGGHLGHVFDDVPSQPTGTRFCVNSASLCFEPKQVKK